MSVGQLLTKVQASDDRLESNLSTMLQQVRGTKLFWYLRQGKVRCMVREYGSPTLFLMFSCAEYKSADIEQYLRKVNNVPKNYPIGRLCMCQGSHLGFKKIFSQVSCLFQHSLAQRCSFG